MHWWQSRSNWSPLGPRRRRFAINPILLFHFLIVIHTTILHIHTNTRSFMRIKQHLQARASLMCFQFTKRRHQVISKWGGIWRVFFDWLPAYGWRTRRRNQEVLLYCWGSEVIGLWHGCRCAQGNEGIRIRTINAKDCW